MLKGINPLLGPDVLRVLAQMGHGDTIVLADANFPATRVASTCTCPQVLRMDCDGITALSAVLSLLPLDSYVETAVFTMQVVGAPQEIPPVVAEAMPLIMAEGAMIASLERFSFYDAAKTAFAVIHTRESRPYGNFILRKGVINL